MNRQQKQFIVDAIANNEQVVLKQLAQSFDDLYDNNHKKIIKVFNLNEIEAIRLLPFEHESIAKLTNYLANLDVDIDCREGVIHFLVSRLKLIEPAPFWNFFYKILEFKKYPVHYISKPFKAKKELVRAAFGNVQQKNIFDTENKSSLLLRANNEDLQKLCRLSFKNRRNDNEWEAQDQHFRQEFHKRYRNYVNYNEDNQERRRNEKAWEWYGINVKQADFGFWLEFNDILDKQLRDEFIMRASVRAHEQMDIILLNLGREVDPEKDYLIVMFQKRLQELDELLKFNQAPDIEEHSQKSLLNVA